MKNKVILLILVCLLTLCGLFGCKANKEDVELATESEIIAYAKKTYGKVKHISTSEEQFERTCVFEDKEYGFTYYVTSYVHAVGIDASIAGYKEGKSSDFLVQYCQVLRELLMSNSKYEIRQFNAVNLKEFMCYVYGVNSDNIDDVIKTTVKLINKYDKRGFFTDGEIRLYDTEYLGSYNMKEKKYVSEEEYFANQMKYYVESDVNRPGWEKQKIEYVRCERVPLSQIPGIDDYELVYNNLTSDSLVYVFYFNIGGQEYFYANVKVWMNNSDRYYTNH